MDKRQVYYNGTWEKYESGAREALWEIREGKAYFGAGFAFEMEGLPQRNGILQDYQGGEKAVIPFPAKRHLVVDRVSVAPDSEKLYMPDVKTLCPVSYTHLKERVENLEGQIKKEIYSRGLVAKYTFSDILGRSEVMEECRYKARQFAKHHANVLIFGETGTGKELFRCV